MGRHTVRIGVFIPGKGGCQLLDAACIDVFGTMSHKYWSAMSSFAPKAAIDAAPDVEIHFIGPVKAGEPIEMTADQKIVATNHWSDPEVAPGKLDIVIVPGPDPTAPFPEDAVAWLAQHGGRPETDILSVCTGIFLCGEAGLLKGRKACGPRGFQQMIQGKDFGVGELVGHKYRWIQDGNFWSSGGVTNGNDLVAAYCRSSEKHFPRPLVELACDLVEVGDRPQMYQTELKTFESYFA